MVKKGKQIIKFAAHRECSSCGEMKYFSSSRGKVCRDCNYNKKKITSKNNYESKARQANIICTFPDCKKGKYARKLCYLHYQQDYLKRKKEIKKLKLMRSI